MTINAAEKIDRDDQARPHRHLGDQGVRARRLHPRGRPRHPGVGRGRRVERPARWPACTTGARTLRIADGPDEVHKVLIAKNVIGAYENGDGWDFGN